MNPQPTTWQRLATLLLEQNVDEWVAERRHPEARTSWQLLARQLRKATDGQVSVTGETLRGRYAEFDLPDQAAS